MSTPMQINTFDIMLVNMSKQPTISIDHEEGLGEDYAHDAAAGVEIATEITCCGPCEDNMIGGYTCDRRSVRSMPAPDRDGVPMLVVWHA